MAKATAKQVKPQQAEHSSRIALNPDAIREISRPPSKSDLGSLQPKDSLLYNGKMHETNTDLKDNPDFLDFAKSHQWEDRRKFGFTRSSSVFDWIEAVYKPWIGNGLYRSIFKTIDSQLYIHFHKKLSELDADARQAMVDRLKLPAEKDVSLQALSESERQRQETLREFWRGQQRKKRNPEPPLPIIHPNVPKPF